jgi:hypothetical protein
MSMSTWTSATYHRFEGDDAGSARFDLWGVEGRALLLERGGVPGAVVGSAVNRWSALRLFHMRSLTHQQEAQLLEFRLILVYCTQYTCDRLIM